VIAYKPDWRIDSPNYRLRAGDDFALEMLNAVERQQPARDWDCLPYR